MTDEPIAKRFLDLAEKHCSNTLAAVAITRVTRDLGELRALRNCLGTLLAHNNNGELSTLEALQSDIRWRHDLIDASSVVEARIAEICAPDVRDPIEFAQLVVDLGEEADIAAGKGIWMPDLELIFGGQEGGE